MALEDSFGSGSNGGNGGPQLRYSRSADAPQTDAAMSKALELARQIEELLEDTRSIVAPMPTEHDPRAHSTRMARAMVASLVDELEVLVKPRILRSS